MGTRQPGDTIVQKNYKNAKLLIIEDNPDHGMIINRVVGQCLPQVKATLAASEAEAIQYLEQCCEAEWELPKLILLDLYMPERQSGWRLLDKIKSMPAGMAKVPVVLLSHSNSPADVAEAYQRGCASYLIKPATAEEWSRYFNQLRLFWWETATLPRTEISLL
ncbi:MULTISPECIES: response regulator [Spirosoma]|uniref:Response regulator n=1 Tax=Spirosoma sordidisoli TaxID=2502893 RepID=A0A4Q2UND8_9BACT|nr:MULTISPECIES: response regulator [Spirosoma]RYC70342.1 response regulator [Spirosoma sordidisoli]